MKLTWDQIDGWFDHKTFYDWLLERLPVGARVAEVGVLCGKSIVYLAQESKNRGLGLNLYAIDLFKVCDEYRPWLHEYADKESFYELYLDNLRRAEVQRDITTFNMDSLKAAQIVDDEYLDAVFIDASHDEASVSADIKAWRPKLKRGGILAGDDYTWKGVATAVDRLVPGRQIMRQVWWIQI